VVLGVSLVLGVAGVPVVGRPAMEGGLGVSLGAGGAFCAWATPVMPHIHTAAMERRVCKKLLMGMLLFSLRVTHLVFDRRFAVNTKDA